MTEHGRRLTCSTCFHEISATAKNCPSCGAAVKSANRSAASVTAGAGFWAFNIAMAVWLLKSQGADSGSSAAIQEDVAGALPDIGLLPLISLWLIGAMLLGYLAFKSRAK